MTVIQVNNEPEDFQEDSEESSDYSDYEQSSDSSEDDESLLEEKERTCEFQQLYGDKARQDHSFVGRAYRCEECCCTGCYDCLWPDGWETRLRDNIFMCYPCYRRNQMIMDIG